MSDIDLSDHYSKRTRYQCDYCEFSSLEENTMNLHLKSEHIDKIEEHMGVKI